MYLWIHSPSKNSYNFRYLQIQFLVYRIIGYEYMTYQTIDLFEFYHLMGHMSNSKKALAEKSCLIDDHQSNKLIIDQT